MAGWRNWFNWGCRETEASRIGIRSSWMWKAALLRRKPETFEGQWNPRRVNQGGNKKS